MAALNRFSISSFTYKYATIAYFEMGSQMNRGIEESRKTADISHFAEPIYNSYKLVLTTYSHPFRVDVTMKNVIFTFNTILLSQLNGVHSRRATKRYTANTGRKKRRRKKEKQK